MNVLITGGAGFKGAVLSQQLLDAGHKVHVIDTLKWGAWPLMGLLTHPNFSFERGDVTQKSIATYIKDYDTIINLAAVVGHPACDAHRDEAEETNDAFVKRLCAALSKQQYLLHASTGSVYGKLEDTCTEESPCNPLSLYGITKLNAEKYVANVGGVSLRFATAFGVSPCMRFDVVPAFFSWKSLTDRYMVVYQSHARRTLIDVKDMGRSYLFGMENYGTMQGQVYNVGDERLNVTKRRVVDLVKEYVEASEGYKVPIFDESTMEDKDQRDYEVSYSKINKLGFECKVMIEQGIQETLLAAKAVIGTNANPWRIN